MKKWNHHVLIHGFALLHAGTVALCAWLGIPDTLALTALTMLMAVFLCYEENLTVDISIMALILVNVLGFLLGNLGAQVLLNFLPSVWKNIVSTVVVTEMMGWALYWFAHTFSPANAASYDRKLSWKRRRGLLVGSIAVIFGLRVYIDLSYQGNIFQESAIVGILVIISVVLLGFMIRFASKMQLEATDQRTRRHQAEFRYMTLKSQVDPHFLFNSLNVLDSIVLEGTPQEASAYIHKLASIYRYLMQHEAKKLVPLSEEIQFARTYRYPQRLHHPLHPAAPAGKCHQAQRHQSGEPAHRERIHGREKHYHAQHTHSQGIHAAIYRNWPAVYPQPVQGPGRRRDNSHANA